MTDQKQRKLVTVFLFAGLVTAVFYLGYDLGQTVPKTIEIKNVVNTTPGVDTQADLTPLWETWDLIDAKYLHGEEVTDQDKVYGAASGLIRSLGDPNSQFFKPSDGQKFEEDIQGNFGGIGAEIGLNEEGMLIVVSPLKKSPAEKAGLKPEDIILEVNSTSTLGLSVEDAVKIIRGPINSKVTLTIARNGWQEPKEITITRQNIVIPTLDYEIKEDSIAYISIYGFNANLNQLFHKAVIDILGKGSRGLVIDLRNNPGGYLQVAIDMAGWFLPRGTLVVSESTREGINKKFYASGNEALAEMPIVILVNKGSASASEILAGAIRAHKPIKLIGTTTFGKGTVQELTTLSDGSSVKITIANWILPDGTIIDGEGLKPDIVIENPKDETDSDPQLEKALEIIRSEVKKSASPLFRLSL